MLVENGRPPPSKKRLVIKGFKKAPQLPDDFELGTWHQLERAVTAVQRATAVDTSLEELYQAVESLCVHQHSAKLYARLCAACDRHIAALVADLSGHLAKGPQAFLAAMRACWRTHCEQMVLIRSIFLYLDRSFVVAQQAAAARSIYDMGLLQFRQHLEAQPKVVPTVVEGVLELLQQRRQHEAADTALLATMLRMLRALGLYAATFAGPFLAAARQHYHEEGLRLSAELAPSAYLAHCELRLSEEAATCAALLERATEAPLLAAVREELVEAHFAGLLAAGLGGMLQEQRQEDLARLFRLAQLIGRTGELQAAVRAWLIAAGTALVQDTHKDASLVQSLLDLKLKLDAILEGPFQSHPGCTKALRDAYERIINSRDNKPAELIAKFMDAKLRGSGRAHESDAALEASLERALVLFRFIQGKDIFEAFYKKDFAKRLLMGKSASVDIEKAMIAKLKAECGAQYTSKLEGMFKDEQVSRDIAQAFKLSREAQAKMTAGLEANVRVLTSGFWPSYPIVTGNLPAEIVQAQEAFQEHYLAKYSGRRLVWHSTLETCTVKAAYAGGDKDLQVSMHQAAVLLLFNRRDELTFKEIEAALRLPDGELRRTLQSLALGKVRVLKKAPAGKEVGDADVFKYVADFKHALVRIKINQIQIQETVDESKRTNEQVMQDRQHQMDAALVRTMKARKQLSHQLLIGEVMPQLKFNVKASDLKKRIEGLIDREYMCRDATTHDLYNYVA